MLVVDDSEEGRELENEDDEEKEDERDEEEEGELEDDEDITLAADELEEGIAIGEMQFEPACCLITYSHEQTFRYMKLVRKRSIRLPPNDPFSYDVKLHKNSGHNEII